MNAPSYGTRVRYVGTNIAIPDGFQEIPERIGREGKVVVANDGSGNDIISDQWPVNVEWDNGDPTQTCFQGEIEVLGKDNDDEPS